MVKMLTLLVSKFTCIFVEKKIRVAFANHIFFSAKILARGMPYLKIQVLKIR